MIHGQLAAWGPWVLSAAALYWFAMWALKPGETDHSALYRDLGTNLSELFHQTLRHGDAAPDWQSLKHTVEVLSDRVHGFDKPTALAADVVVRSCAHFARAPQNNEARRQFSDYANAVLAYLYKGRGVCMRKLKKVNSAADIL